MNSARHNEPSPEQAPGYYRQGLRPDDSGRHPSPQQAAANYAVRIKFVAAIVALFIAKINLFAAGCVDGISIDVQVDGSVYIEAYGWAGSDVSGDKLRFIEIYLNSDLAVSKEVQPFLREDVSSSTGRPDWRNSGWNLKESSRQAIGFGNWSVKVMAHFESGEKCELLCPKKEWQSNGMLMDFPSIAFVLLSIFLIVLFFGFLLHQAFDGRTALGAKSIIFWIATAFLIGFRLWLVVPGTLFAIADAGHDDLLFVKLASNIIGGDWLGSYSQFTLMKGPMYPIWIASVFRLGLPLLLSQHILYVCMAILLIIGIRPLVSKRWLLLLIFIFLLFNPMTNDTIELARVSRSGLTPALTMGILAGTLVLYTRRGQASWVYFVWALITGACLSAFWLVREESAWILALVIPLWAGIVYSLWRENVLSKNKKIAILLTPGLFLILSLTAVSAVNYLYYGIFTTCEFKAKPFKDAYGALVRIQPKERKPFVPITKETIQQAYAASPTFAELRPFLGGELGKAWATHRNPNSKEPADSGEIEGGWFVWALRDAVALSGNANSGDQAMKFYTSMANEINAACDRGELKSTRKRSGFTPIIDLHEMPMIVINFAKAWLSMSTFEGLVFRTPISFGNPHNMELFADVTRDRIISKDGQFIILKKQRKMDQIKYNIWMSIGCIYQIFIPVLGILALTVFLLTSFYSMVNHRWTFLLTLNLALLLGISALLGIISIIETTSFHAIIISYMAPSYVIYLIFIVTAWLPWIDRNASRRGD